MAKFCTKCGAPLVEGEVHVCPAMNQATPQAEQPQMNQAAPQYQQPQMNQVAPQVQQPQMNQAAPQYQQPQMNQGAPQYQQPQMNQATAQYQQQAATAAKNIFNEFVAVLKSPVSKGIEMVEQCDFKNAVIMFILQGIISGLFTLALLSKGGEFISVLSGLAGSFGGSFGDALKLPMFRGFMVTFVLSVGLNFVFAGLIFAMNSICKVSLNYKQSVCMVAVRSVVLCVAILVALLVFELHIGAGLFLFFFVSIWGFFEVLLVESSFIKNEKKEMLALLYMIVVLLWIMIAFFVFSKVCTLYFPDSVRAIMSNPKELFQELLQEFM